MKFTTILVAAMAATFATANPVAIPEDAAPTVAVAAAPADSGVAQAGEAAINCKLCDEHFRRCMKSMACWYDPMACSKSCIIDICRAWKGGCRSCGYTSC